MIFDENAFARMIERTDGDDAPRPEHQRQLRERALEAFDHAQAEAARPTVLSRSLTLSRWIMRHPISRVAAAVVFVLAIGGVVVLFHGGGATPAFADFIEPILEARTAKYKITTEMTLSAEMKERQAAAIMEGSSAGFIKFLSDKMKEGLSDNEKERLFSELKGLSADEKERLSAELKEGRLSDEMKDRLVAEFKKGLAAQRPPMPDLPASTGEVMMLDSYRSRQEMEMPDKSKMVMIFDWRQGKCLSLSPTEKQATVLNITNMPEDNKPKSSNPLAEFRSLLLDTRDQPESKRESLGEKDMDGRHVVGFRISGRGMVLDLWGDPKTGLPVRLVGTMAMMPNVKVTMSDFIFNVDMDESLFSVEPPAGYEIIKAPTVDASPPEEKDLIETFRRYSELGGGPFPESLDMGPIFQILAKKLQPQSGFEKGQKPPKPSAKQIQEMMENQVKLQRGVMFAVMLSPEADAHYAGKGIKLGAADTPIFWYCSKESKKYRIIYADLSVREADAPPSAPDAQPVPGAAGPKK